MKNKEVKDEAIDTGKVLSDEDLNIEDNKESPTGAQSNEQHTEQTQTQPKESDKSQEYLEMAQRIQAEFDNYRRRTAESAKDSRQDGISFAVETLLPVIDSISSAKRQLKDDAFLKSIELVYKQTLDCFSKLGVSKIDAVGKPFNPEYHNAIMAEHKEGVQPDIVLDEFQEGFELNGKVIRHSVVKVSK